MSYITIDEFKALPLGVSLKGMDNTSLQYILDVATGNVEQFCERVFSSAYYTETFVGNDDTKHILWNYPVLQYESVTQTASTGDTVLDVGMLRRTSVNDSAGILELSGVDTVTTFSSSYVYTVVYRAGYDTIPATIKHATALWATELLQPDYTGPQAGTVELVPATSEQISELLTIWKRRRI